MLTIRKQLIIITVFLGLLLVGTGVMAQVNQEQQIRNAIANGLVYLNDQNTWGTEILLLHYLDLADGSHNIRTNITDRSFRMTEFDYASSQFVRGEDVNRDRIDPEFFQKAFSNDFVDLFTCEPLTIPWIFSLGNQVNDSEEDSGMYKTSHSMILLELMLADYSRGGRCGESPAVVQIPPVLTAKARQVTSLLGDRSYYDAWVERIGALAWFDQTISTNDIDYILQQQQGNGGWRGAEHYDINDSSTHPTAKTIWALAGVLQQ